MSAQDKNKYLTLKSGYKIPLLGFGTWQLGGEVAESSVSQALTVGYRHIDTADAYGNHHQVAAAIKKSGLEREEIFLTTKIWRESLGENEVPKAVDRFLEELETDYLDLLLIHWPNKEVPVAETLAAMDKAKKAGKARSVGVSNFTIRHLKEALATGVLIENNQVEFHPSLNQKELKEFCDKEGILLTAYSPLGRGQDLQLPLIQELARKYQRRESQIILNWLISKNIVAIPKSANPQHIEDNFLSLEFQLEASDIAAIDNIQSSHNRVVRPAFAEFDD